MKVLVSKKTGMVALVAGPNITNRRAGTVFGSAPKDAARLLGREQATAVAKEDLPGDPKDYDEVTIDLEAAQVVEPMKSKEAGSDDEQVAALKAEVDAANKVTLAGQAKLKSLQDKYDALEKSGTAQAEEYDKNAKESAKQNSALKSKVVELEDSNASLEAGVEQLEKANAAQIKAHEAKVAELEKENAALKAEVEKAKQPAPKQ